MRLSLFFVALWLAAAAAATCSHTRTVGDKGSAESSRESAEGSSARHKRASSGRGETTQESPSSRAAPAPQLSTSATGILKDGGAALLQQRLHAQGYLTNDKKTGKLDDATEAALRSFQRDRHLPATGIPDDATVNALGLKPSDVFRTANSPASHP
jgi:peptidoglycan hydrolase-like protein with peptidoglycan-binding domain